MTDYVREHSIGELLRHSVAIYWRHFRSLFVAYLVPALPVALLQAEAQRREATGLVIGFGLLNLVVAGLASGAVTMIVSDVCRGRPTSARRAYRALLGRRTLVVIAVSILSLLAVVASVLLLFVPFLFVYPSLLVGVPAAVLENKGPIAAIKRSWQLARGLRLRNWGVMLAIFAIAIAAAVVATIPIGVAAAMILDDDESFERLLSLVATVMQTLVIPWALVLQVLLYYDSRVRHEGDTKPLTEDLRW